MPLVLRYKGERVLKARRSKALAGRPAWQQKLPDTSEGRGAYKIAAAHEKQFTRAFREAVKGMLTPETEKAFKEAWASNSVPRVLSVFPFYAEGEEGSVALKNFVARMEQAYATVINASGTAEAKRIRDKFKTDFVFTPVEIAKAKRVATAPKAKPPVMVPVVPVNPRSVAWIRNRGMELVAEGVTKPQRKIIRSFVEEGFRRGARAEEVYSDLKANIGLLDREVLAVENRRALYEASGMSRDKVASETEAYRELMLERRAERIARTETMFAQAQGRLDSWLSAKEEGALPDVVRVWVSAPDSCPLCAELDGAEADLEGSFEDSEGETYESAPAHPHCGCTETLRRASDADAQSEAEADAE